VRNTDTDLAIPDFVAGYKPLADCTGVEIDCESRNVWVDGTPIELAAKEFELLVYLAQHPGRVLTHRVLLKAIWGPHAVNRPEHLRVLVGALRKKVETNPSTPRLILTEPWVGYRFTDG